MEAPERVIDAFFRDARIEAVRTAPGQWAAMLRGERKLTIPVAFTIRGETLHIESFFMRHPQDNLDRFYELLLRRNARAYGIAFALVAVVQGTIVSAFSFWVLGLDVAGSAVETLVAEVTAPDIPTALTFNIPIAGSVASGTITVPAGSNRAVALRAYDAGGILTHNGGTTINIQPGANPSVAITLAPLTGDPMLPLTLEAMEAEHMEIDPILEACGEGFKRLAEHGVTLDLLSQISEQFAAVAPTLDSLVMTVFGGKPDERVALAARDAAVRRLVYAGSSSVYGDTPTLPKREDMPTSPLSPYALQKLVGEQYAQLFTRLYGFETVTIRYFNVFGPRQDPSSPYSGVISVFAKALLENTSPTIYGDGEQTRDFTYVANVVDGVLRAVEAPGAAGAVAAAYAQRLRERISLTRLVEGRYVNRPGQGIHPLQLHQPPGISEDIIDAAAAGLRRELRVVQEPDLRRVLEGAAKAGVDVSKVRQALLGGFAAMALGSPLWALLVLLVLKVVLDLRAHLKEHRAS